MSPASRSGLSMDRMLRLQSVIASLSVTLTPEEVADTVLRHAMEALGAEAGSVVVVTDDETRLDRLCTLGYRTDLLDQFEHDGLKDPFAATEAMHTGEVLWLPSLAAWNERYPELAGLQTELGFAAAACIPLTAHGRKLGVLVLSFRHPREGSDEDRAFALTLAQQCAQALERARLYAAERAARAQAEAERARLYDLFMHAPARIALTQGPNHVYVFANERYVAELDNPDIIGRPARDVFPGADDQGIIAVADGVFATGEPYIAREALFRVDRDRDGWEEDRFFDVVLQPSYKADGTVDGVMLFSVDVTEAVRTRRRVEELLAERNAILGRVADGLVIIDATRQIVFVNEAAQSIFGLDVWGMDWHTMTDRLHLTAGNARSAAEARSILDQALESGEVMPFEHRLGRPDATEVIVQGSVAPVPGDGGTHRGAVVTFRDVTGQRTLERQKDDFLAAAAHDLKTPLTTIKGVTQIVQRRVSRWEASKGERLMRDLERIDSTVSKMNMLINTLLDITRLQMDQPLTLEKRETDLTAMATAVVNDQRAVSKRHTLRLESDGARVVGLFDAFRIERVLTNLISNAMRYSPQGGEIVVTIGQVRQASVPWAVLTVQDQGMGVPLQDAPYIFDRFYRAGNVEGKISGAGIGLAGVRQIVTQHGGSIDVQSSEGKGATFSVRLPLGS